MKSAAGIPDIVVIVAGLMALTVAGPSLGLLDPLLHWVDPNPAASPILVTLFLLLMLLCVAAKIISATLSLSIAVLWFSPILSLRTKAAVTVAGLVAILMDLVWAAFVHRGW